MQWDIHVNQERYSGPWLGLLSLKKFRGPRYVADLGGPRWLEKKMKKKYIVLANYLKEKNQLCSVII